MTPYNLFSRLLCVIVLPFQNGIDKELQFLFCLALKCKNVEVVEEKIIKGLNQ